MAETIILRKTFRLTIVLSIKNTMNKERKDLQKKLYERIVQWKKTDAMLSCSDLKKRVMNKTIKNPAETLTRAELQLIADTFRTSRNSDADSSSNLSGAVYDFDQLIQNASRTIDMLIRDLDRQITPKSSLLPIKGISKVMQARLRDLHIYDAAALLLHGRTKQGRNKIAQKLKIDEKLVASWIKQADLWRIPGMTTDLAYLLVLAGIRCVKDLARTDENKIYPILEGLYASQPDFQLVSKPELAKMIGNADELAVYSISSSVFSRTLEEKLSQKIERNASLTANEISKLIHEARTETQSDFIQIAKSTDKEPIHLFRDKFIHNETDGNANGEVIRKGLGFLDDVQYALPLPHTLSGIVYKRKYNEKDSEKKAFSGVKVEIGGIVSPSENLKGPNALPSCITDARGRFIIVLPDKYCMKETLIVTVSEGGRKQAFIKSAAEIIASVPQQKTLEQFYELDALGDEIDRLDVLIKSVREKKTLASANALKNENSELNKLLYGDKSKGNQGYYKQKRDLLNDYNGKKEAILEKFGKKDIESAFNQFLAGLDKLDARLEGTDFNPEKDEGFVIVEELFLDKDKYLDKALPKVRLMGNDDQVIQLSSDTAPSKVFNYSMLQRLVEPDISFTGFNSGKNGRKTLSQPIDVMAFREKMYQDPWQYPQACSLGIGYVLNMHQSWIPDGFALGSLLYSQILAPGEEQRLIVRENKQSYLITDDAEGIDTVNEHSTLLQEDDTNAAFNYAVNQLSTADSNYSYSAKTKSFGGSFGIGGAFSGISAMLGLSGGYSKSSGKASSSARQSNSHNEASSAAQSFQHSIKNASDRISRAKRVSMEMATSDVSDSVATKIIANHNHSHAMTVQYWEVMRRYRLETCIDGIDLVLFVPLKLIRFLPQGQPFQAGNVTPEIFDRNHFIQRYGTLLQYASILENILPYRYRTGLNLIRQYAASPEWIMESSENSETDLILEFKGNFLSFDDLSAHLVLKNGRGSVAGEIEQYERAELDVTYKTTRELKQGIRSIRNERGDVTVRVKFSLPADIVNDDLSHITLYYSSEGLSYKLYQDESTLTEAERKAYDNLLDEKWHLAKNNKGSEKEKKNIQHYLSQLPEAYVFPIVQMSVRELKALGVPTIYDAKITSPDRIGVSLSSSSLYSSVNFSITSIVKTLRRQEFMQMESLLQHVASETLHYSQAVWSSLSDDERVMMLEQYTINMDFGKEFESEDENTGNNRQNVRKTDVIDIPLLNCVNVKKLLGFYGNCMLLPFTYPQSLAKRLGKTAVEIQESLYRYHTNSFRAPTTTISLPTDGMIGEAVLGETNVSEEIDLTRFWNWQDSPIDKMTIDSSYLNRMDYLADKSTKDISALNLQGVVPSTPITVQDLISTLASKQAPTFSNITGLDQLKEVLNAGTTSASVGRDKVIASSSDLTKTALNFLSKQKNNSQTADDNTSQPGEKGVGANNASGDFGQKENDEPEPEQQSPSVMNEEENQEFGQTQDENDTSSRDSNLDNNKDTDAEKRKKITELANLCYSMGMNPEEFVKKLTN